jgi:hypothetical protein
MYRRRRQAREIQFSFDSFLDVVANVCGIIIRLILVAWVGARSYHAALAHQTPDETPQQQTAAVQGAKAESADPLEQALARHREELEREQKRLLQQLRQHEQLEALTGQEAEQLTALTMTEARLLDQKNQLEKTGKDQQAALQTTQLTLAELQQRSARVAAELRELEKEPAATKTLHYRTPVSRPVHTDELHFECQGGRIGFIDVQAFMIEIRRDLEDKSKLLKSQWEVSGVAGPVGAYQLRYTVDREHGPLEVGDGPPSLGSGFRYGLAGWVVEPITQVRGETAQAALTAGSQFRRLVDALDPEQGVVTLWVYPDSFALYRQLRDYLHEHNIEVAGRPMPLGMPIASSRGGTASRGQ